MKYTSRRIVENFKESVENNLLFSRGLIYREIKKKDMAMKNKVCYI